MHLITSITPLVPAWVCVSGNLRTTIAMSMSHNPQTCTMCCSSSRKCSTSIGRPLHPFPPLDISFRCPKLSPDFIFLHQIPVLVPVRSEPKPRLNSDGLELNSVSLVKLKLQPDRLRIPGCLNGGGFFSVFFLSFSC